MSEELHWEAAPLQLRLALEIVISFWREYRLWVNKEQFLFLSVTSDLVEWKSPSRDLVRVVEMISLLVAMACEGQQS